MAIIQSIASETPSKAEALAGEAVDRAVWTVAELFGAEPTKGPRLHVLLLADDAHAADVVRDHIGAIERLSRHRVSVVNPIRNRRAWRLAADRFDVVVVHYSICILFDYFLPPPVAEWLRTFAGPKIQIIQDEMRWIDRMTRRMAELRIDAVFSSLVPDNVRRVYHHRHLAGVRFVSSLPGYVPRRLHGISTPPLSLRPYHLVYRGRPLPVWFGRFGQEKAEIGLHALSLAERFGLDADCKVREEDRIYGKAWNKLLMSGRATVATEGGSTVFDFDESIQAGAVAYRRAHPGASDEDVWRAVVAPHEGNVVHKTLTPRVLEAIMCRTALVMYPGALRGILEPWEHYIPLERDGSNDEEVARALRDDRQLEEIIERAYRRIADDPFLQFDAYVGAIDRVTGDLADGVTDGRASLTTGPGALARVATSLAVGFLEERVSAFESPHTFSGKVWIVYGAPNARRAALLFRRVGTFR